MQRFGLSGQPINLTSGTTSANNNALLTALLTTGLARLLAAAALFSLSLLQTAHAADGIEGDAAAGASKAAVCGACHGQDGKALQVEYPNLAGQGAGYIAKQLADYKSGARTNAIMTGMAAALSDQDMADIAAHFAGLPAVQGVAEDREDLKTGESIYRGGITSAKIPACMGCHAPSGRGNPAANWPALAGQNAAYIALTLRSFRSGERNNDPNEMMRMVSHRLSDNEIEAIANYVQGLN